MMEGQMWQPPVGPGAGAIAAYRRAAAQTGSPGEQIVMLYEGAIRSLHAARKAIVHGQIEERHREVRRAFAIVGGLQACLDFERGGDVARLLDRFYGYVLTRLPQIDLLNDPAICSELAERLEEMRTSWSAIARPGTPAAPAVPARPSAVA
ncbi:flagellar export chaperone FliS [Geminicoccaceae bacterium 1502E]|nr:flagellar export chaperone FliS [Geminicoccaceae bacterium 1502E]